MSIGKQIRIMRQKQQVSQKVLEERSGIKREYLSKIEQGKLKNPTLNTIIKIAQGLDVPLESLLLFNPAVPCLPELVRHIDSIEEKLNLLAEDLSKLKQGLSLINNQNSEQQKLRLNG